MARKSLIFTAALALSITLRLTPTTAQLSAVQPSDDKQNPSRSQPPAPGTGNQDQQPPTQPERENGSANGPNQHGTNNVTVTIQTPRPDDQRDSRADQAKGQQGDAAKDWWARATTAATVAQAFFAFVLLLLTGALVFVGWKQRETYQATVADSRLIARAYIHVAVSKFANYGPNMTPEATLHVQNSGRTPATITDIRVISAIAPYLPSEPPYKLMRNPLRGHDYLASDDHVDLTPILNPISPEKHSLIEKGEEHLWVLGYIDYIDVFEVRWRHGYARVYDLGLQRLVFERTVGYNYDRERKKGEGNDWNQPQD